MKKSGSYKSRTQLALNTLYSLEKTSGLIREQIHKYIKSIGLTPIQYSIIDILGHNGPLKISEIYKKLLIKNGNKTMILDSLEKIDLIKRVFSKHDRREIIIELTPSGEKFFNKHYSVYGNFVEETLSVLSQADQTSLIAILQKIEGKL